MPHPDRHDRDAARAELEALGAGLHRQPPVEHDVALVLRVGVKRRRGAVREQELEHRQTAAGGLARHPDDRQGAEEPQPLARAGRRPRRRRLSCGECR